MNKVDNLMATTRVISDMTGGEYSTPMPKMKLKQRSMGQPMCCHICGKSHVTLCKDESSSGEYICKACKDALVKAVPEVIMKEVCDKIREVVVYNG